MVQAQREIVLRQARSRYGALPADLETRVANAERATLDLLLERVLQAATLDEFMAGL